MNCRALPACHRFPASSAKWWLLVFGTAACLLYGGLSIMAAVVEVTPVFTMADNNGRYDRNPSMALFGGEAWLFYTKGDDGSSGGVRDGVYNPDNDSYVIWYKRGPLTQDIVNASETRLDLSETNRPEGFDQRDVSAVVFQNQLYVFASAGFGGSQQPVYYYVWDGSSWSGPTSLGTGGGGHVNAVADAGWVYFTLETGVGVTLQAVAYSWDGATLNGPYTIAAGNGVPKITIKDGVLYAVSIAPSTTTINLHSCPASATPSTWTYLSDPITVTGASVWDPAIYYDGISLGVMAAPSTAVPDQQWLVGTRSTDNGFTWTPVKRISSGGNGTETWWDYWPCPFPLGGGDLFLLYATEAKEGIYADGMIGTVAVDWNMDNDHSFYIQPGMNMANSGDTVTIGPGAVWRGRGNRDLELTDKALLVSGQLDAVDTTTIDCQGSVSEPHRAFYIHDASSQEIIIEKLTIVNSYTADGVILVGGSNTQPIIRNCRIMNGTGAGIRVPGGAGLTVNDCTILHMDGDGISAGSLMSPVTSIGVSGTVLARNTGAGIRVASSLGTSITTTTMAFNGIGCSVAVGEPPLDAGKADWEFSLTRSVAVFNEGKGIELVSYFGSITIECDNSYGNGITGFPPGYGTDSPYRNCSYDPLFCDAAGDNYHVALNSSSVPGQNPCNDSLGALGAGCGPVYKCGDANGDNKIGIGDAVFIISYVFRGGPAPYPFEAGDANCDGKVNVGDAIYLVSYIFRGGPAPCCP